MHFFPADLCFHAFRLFVNVVLLRPRSFRNEISERFSRECCVSFDGLGKRKPENESCDARGMSNETKKKRWSATSFGAGPWKARFSAIKRKEGNIFFFCMSEFGECASRFVYLSLLPFAGLRKASRTRISTFTSENQLRDCRYYIRLRLFLLRPCPFGVCNFLCSRDQGCACWL